jgi:hypothetical protein
MKFWMKLATITLIISILLTGTTGCSSSSSHKYEMAATSDLPMTMQQAPVRVQEAYQFAAANPEIAQAIPCYCGCGGMGHTSNYSCFVAEEAAGGALTYDEHALGCGICVDIAQDTMRLLDDGKSVDEIFVDVNGRYARFGPPTPLEG